MTFRAFCLVVAVGITCEALHLKETQDAQENLLQRVDLNSMTETKRAYTIWNALNRITKSDHMDDEAKGVALMEVMENVERRSPNSTKPTHPFYCVSDLLGPLQIWLAATNIQRLMQHAGTTIERFAHGTESASMLSLFLSRGFRSSSDCGTYTHYNRMCAGSVSELSFNLLGATAAIASQVKKCVDTYDHKNEVIWGLSECQSDTSKYIVNTLSFLGQILYAIRKIRSGGEAYNAEESLIAGYFRAVQHFMFIAAAVVDGEACSTGAWGLHCAAESVEATAYITGMGNSINNICDYCYPEPPDESRCLFGYGWGYDKSKLRSKEGWATYLEHRAHMYLKDLGSYNSSSLLSEMDKFVDPGVQPRWTNADALEGKEEVKLEDIKLEFPSGTGK